MPACEICGSPEHTTDLHVAAIEDGVRLPRRPARADGVDELGWAAIALLAAVAIGAALVAIFWH